MVFSFPNTGYAPLYVRIVMPGEWYGRDHCLQHGAGGNQPTPEAYRTDPLVEFYDSRFEFDKVSDGIKAQFVSRYYLSTLLGHGPRALNLDGGIPVWTANATTMRDLSAILSHLVVG